MVALVAIIIINNVVNHFADRNRLENQGSVEELLQSIEVVAGSKVLTESNKTKIIDRLLNEYGVFEGKEN